MSLEVQTFKSTPRAGLALLAASVFALGAAALRWGLSPDYALNATGWGLIGGMAVVTALTVLNLIYPSILTLGPDGFGWRAWSGGEFFRWTEVSELAAVAGPLGNPLLAFNLTPGRPTDIFPASAFVRRPAGFDRLLGNRWSVPNTELVALLNRYRAAAAVS
jgi:hypothetical protein